jgi:hypothetical protein
MNNSVSGELTLTTWYVNRHRALEILGANILNGYWGDPGAVAALLGPQVLRWMQEKNIPSLARLVNKGELRQGSYFFHDARFFSRGLNVRAYDKPSDAQLWFPMKELAPERSDKLEIVLNTKNLTTQSAFGALQGAPCVFVCASIYELSAKRIVARPLVVGSLVEDWGAVSTLYSDSIEIRAADFDAFAEIDFNQQVSDSELNALKDVPEKNVKKFFAEAMRQPFTDKDWGGELGDLFSANARVNGKTVTCGFMFKGPSVFKKMQPADCGKNGDQVVRLYEYPADCFVLQHCHDIAPAVRKMMRAFAVEKQPRRVRYCLIDGRDTYLILKKLGAFKSSARLKTVASDRSIRK